MLIMIPMFTDEHFLSTSDDGIKYESMCMDMLQCICYQAFYHSGTWAHIVGEINARLESNALHIVFKVDIYLNFVSFNSRIVWPMAIVFVNCIRHFFLLNLIWMLNFIPLFVQLSNYYQLQGIKSQGKRFVIIYQGDKYIKCSILASGNVKNVIENLRLSSILLFTLKNYKSRPGVFFTAHEQPSNSCISYLKIQCQKWVKWPKNRYEFGSNAYVCGYHNKSKWFWYTNEKMLR